MGIEDDDDDVNTSENINIIDEDNKKAVEASDDRDQHINSDGLETDSIRSERDDKQNEDAFIEDDDDDVNTSENINIIDEDNKKDVEASDDRDQHINSDGLETDR